MNSPEPAPSPLRPVRRPALAAGAASVARLFPWHAAGFLAVNGALTAANIFTGPPWWGVWPFLATGALLGLHYLLYKAVRVDERWVDERVEELNLKSYDRGHIEGLKARYGDGAAHGSRDAARGPS